MNIQQLKSGSYRIRKTINGVSYSVTIDHKPKIREAEVLIEEKILKSGGVAGKSANYMTFEQAYQVYHDAHMNIFSASTIKNYASIMRNLSYGFLHTSMAIMDSVIVQQEINIYVKTRSAKSAGNARSLIVCVINFVRPELTIKVVVPPRMPVKRYLPTQEDVSRVFDALKDTREYPAILLASYGLRRSEIMALTLDDFHDGRVRINKAMVQDEHKRWIVQDRTKEPDSCRDIKISDTVYDIIQSNPYVLESGRIYSGYAGNLSRTLNRTQDRLGIPRFSVHMLRHYYASLGHSLGIPNKYLMINGGWKSEETLSRVYQDAMQDKADEMQDRFSDALIKTIKKQGN